MRWTIDGELVKPSKLTGKKIGEWILGKTLTEIPKPAPDNLQVTEDAAVDLKSDFRFGLTHPSLGRVTGYAELYEDLLTGGSGEPVLPLPLTVKLVLLTSASVPASMFNVTRKLFAFPASTSATDNAVPLAPDSTTGS